MLIIKKWNVNSGWSWRVHVRLDQNSNNPQPNGLLRISLIWRGERDESEKGEHHADQEYLLLQGQVGVHIILTVLKSNLRPIPWNKAYWEKKKEAWWFTERLHMKIHTGFYFKLLTCGQKIVTRIVHLSVMYNWRTYHQSKKIVTQIVHMYN